MFDRLVESRPNRVPFLGRTGASVVVHAGLVALAVRATAGAAPPALRPAPDTTIWVTDVDPEPARAPDLPAAPLPSGPRFPATAPVGQVDIPTIPAGPLSPDAVTAMDPTVFLGDDRATGVGMGGRPTGPATALGSGAFAGAEVDEPVEPVSQPTPRYPPALAAAGVEGYVDIELVVDTAGRVEPGTVTILSSGHSAFIEPARAAIVASRFRPARRHGVAVRQLVRQRMRFVVAR